MTLSPLTSRRRSCCPASALTNRLFFHCGILVAGVEHDAARRDGRRVVDDRLLHARLAALGDAGLHAHRDHAPAVVLARLDDVDLVAALRAVLRLPQLAADRIPRQALRIAMAVAPDRRQRAGLADERVVLRHRAVVVDAMDLAGRLGEVLRVLHHAALAEGVEEVALPVEGEARAVVRVVGR